VCLHDRGGFDRQGMIDLVVGLTCITRLAVCVSELVKQLSLHFSRLALLYHCPLPSSSFGRNHVNPNGDQVVFWSREAPQNTITFPIPCLVRVPEPLRLSVCDDRV
jgi:hypothetical protein